MGTQGELDGDVEYAIGEQVVEEADETPEQRRNRVRLEALARGRATQQKTRGSGKKLTRPRPPSSEPSSKKEDYRIDRNAVKVLLDVVDTMTTAQLGEEARFNSKERGLIEPSLARIMDRMTPRSAKIFGTLADPIMLGTGFFLWFMRVFGSKSAPRARPTLLRQPAPEAPPPVADTYVPPQAAGYEEGALPADLVNAWEG